jgi:hypothetical protein
MRMSAVGRSADAGRAVRGMGAHLVGCPACRKDRESLRDLVMADVTRTGAPPPYGT